MKLDNSVTMIFIFLVLALLAYFAMQVSILEKQQTNRPTTTGDWPVTYWRGNAGWEYPRYRDHPFYPMPNSPHPRPYPPHEPGGGRARHVGDHGH